MRKKATGIRMETIHVTADLVPLGASIVQLIRTNLEMRGKGTESDPFRRVEQYWTLEGELLFEKDPFLHNSPH